MKAVYVGSLIRRKWNLWAPEIVSVGGGCLKPSEIYQLLNDLGMIRQSIT